jgi:enediyne biosynthesis protein E4
MKLACRTLSSIAITGWWCAALSAEWQTSPGFRYYEVQTLDVPRTGFTSLDGRETGVQFTNFLGEERSLTNQIYHNGSGVALGDVDGDGLCDIYLGNIDGANALYRNLGNWKFEDVTTQAGAACADLDATGVVFGDIDGDGDLDLLVNSIGRGTSAFVNDGRGRFAESTSSAGTAARTGSSSAAMADIDGDGDLELYVANYRISTLRDEPFTRFTVSMVSGKPIVTAVNGRPSSSPDLVGRFTVSAQGAILEHGQPDVLFRNDGRGHFTAMSWTNGAFLDEDGKPLSVPYDFGLSVMMRDLNGDSAPDIYVCNDFDSEDRIWINRGDGTFHLIPRLAMRQTSLFSMGVDVADIDRDGYDDIFVVDMLSREHKRRVVQLGDRRANVGLPGTYENRPQYMRNTLFWNRGDGTYTEIAHLAGLDASEWSWTPLFLDVDLDGYEDLLVSNGHLRDAQNLDYVRRIEAMKKERQRTVLEQLRLRKMFPKLETANLAFRNRGDLRFEDMSAAWGFNTVGVKQGMALADLDNDGDLDLVVTSLNGPALIYRNEATAPRLAVRLKGKAPNTHGIGAKIRVLGGPVSQSQEMICGGRYLSSDDAVRVFAGGSSTNYLTIEVTWRNGKQTVIKDARANRIYEINEESVLTVPSSKSKTQSPPPLFRDVSVLLNHTHHEESFDDFARQPLLARKLSQSGPGVTWFDVDGDGQNDLIIGSGHGGELAVFRNNGRSAFEPVRRAPFNIPVARDQTTLLGFVRGQHRTMLAGSSNYEDGATNGAMARTYDLATGTVQDELPGQAASTGPLALADINSDGELDLFVGSRGMPGRYPQAASSQILRGANGRWLADAENNRQLVSLGLVTSAVFSDLDGDGNSELVMACEWGSLRIFRNDRGTLSPWNPSLSGVSLGSQLSTFNQLTGWWNSVATGDFDGDGRMDILAGNWGENTGYQNVRPEPLHVYFGDFDGNGVFDVMEGSVDYTSKKLIPLRDPNAVFRALPGIGHRFGSLQAYADASIIDVVGNAPTIQKLTVNTLQSMLFLNRGTNFEARPLPIEAQLAPVFGIGIADFNGDGREDAVLAQNFFAVDPMTSRYDGGRGVLLVGNGNGTFRAVSGQESGITVYGEGRGVAVCDYDGDGRVDVCVGQNGAQTKLYHNERARRGLLVQMQGPATNPQANGATMRAIFAGNRFGPAREIHAGHGWLSQDSAVQVLTGSEVIDSIWVRWPGGKVTVSKIPPSAVEVEVDPAGLIKVRR